MNVGQIKKQFHPLHSSRRLYYRHSRRDRPVGNQLSTAFLSAESMKCNMTTYRGKNWFSHNLFLLSSEGHLRKDCGLFSEAAYAPKLPWFP
jgi:hypothetical protein